jgi:hypothetical protein
MIGTPTLIITVVIMYIAGAFVSDNILRDTKIDDIKGVLIELALSSLIISLFTVFPLHLFIYHKSVLVTLPVYMAFVVAHFLVCGSMLTLTSYSIKRSGYFTELWHIANISMLVILVILIR